LCSSCGATLGATKLDLRFGLPDPVRDLPEAARKSKTWGNDLLLQVDGVGAFVRCLLPVRLTGGMTITFGTWLSVHPDDLRRAYDLWQTPDYSTLKLRGVLANAIRPWGPELFAAPAHAEVRNVEHLPYITDSDHPMLRRVLDETWSRDAVLMCIADPLPVAIQRQVTDQWSVELSAGFASRVLDGSLQFAAPGRTMITDVHGTPARWAPEKVHTMVTKGALTQAGQLREDDGEELRRAFWAQSTLEGRQQHELYGFVIRRGSFVRVTCMYDDPEHLAWAVEVWRSVRFHEPVPTRTETTEGTT
jgi:hypothetical protein